MSESNKRAFITGGGGYVGCNLTRYLERQGYDVIAADIKFLSKEEGFESRAQKIKVSDHATIHASGLMPYSVLDVYVAGHKGSGRRIPSYGGRSARCGVPHRLLRDVWKRTGLFTILLHQPLQ